MITMEHVCKSYKVAKRKAGLGEVCKSFFRREHEVIHALKDVSFTIGEGEMVGYIGPNGAGKSSTIKILSGILTPDSGTCTVDGRIPWKNRTEHVRQIGVVFGQRSQLWWDIPVMDSFELLKEIYSVSTTNFNRKLEELTELLQLSEILKTPTRQLSLGQRMRCEVAASLIHEPRILFLDEPTIGLDAVSKLAVRDFIKKMNREHKTTVILTTHDMQDIEAIAERVILIGKGQILLNGSLQDLRLAAMRGREEAKADNESNVETDAAVKEKEIDTSGKDVSADVGNQASQSYLTLDHVMAALYKKLGIL